MHPDIAGHADTGALSPVLRRHPLDPLSADEVQRAVDAVRAHQPMPETIRFVSASVREPPKEEVEEHEQTGTRTAEVVLFDTIDQRLSEVMVDLVAGVVIEWRSVPGAQPSITLDEVQRVEEWTRGHPGFVEALRRRGIGDLSQVDIDPIPAGYHGLPEDESGRRLARILAYVRPSKNGNAYARPVEGLFGVIDMVTGQFLQLEDGDLVPMPTETGEFRAAHISPQREDVRPIVIEQPKGPSFTLDGYALRWQNWHLRVGFTAREGLVLHRIGYADNGQVRPVLNRASYAEMVVPYGDPDRFHQSPLDIGEIGVGMLTNSLELGCDCLGEIRYLDAACCSPTGEPVRIPNAICVHEEDTGILWKHTDFRTGEGEVRRGRRLVISSIASIGNYDYGFFWYLHQDGRIGSEVKATGIVSTRGMHDGEDSPYGKLVAPRLDAPHHQHIFCVRLDLDVDGLRNTVHEVHCEAVPQGPDNPHGNAWVTVSRPLCTEAEAKREIDPLSYRSWVVANPARRNQVGQPVAFRLVPGDNALSFAAPDSALRQRAGFVEHHLWVTPYRSDERYPAGQYPYQHRGGAGLPEWTAENRTIENTDVVVWYTMNHTHVPRPEDWPVMPVAVVGFELKPTGFFDRNPTLDVPPPNRATARCHSDDPS